jgi:hypothetical protein
MIRKEELKDERGEKENYIVKEEYIKDGKKYRKCLIKATPIDSSEIHWFEVEYEEVAPNCWQKVYGSERDLGPIKNSQDF